MLRLALVLAAIVMGAPAASSAPPVPQTVIDFEGVVPDGGEKIFNSTYSVDGFDFTGDFDFRILSSSAPAAEVSESDFGFVQNPPNFTVTLGSGGLFSILSMRAGQAFGSGAGVSSISQIIRRTSPS